MHTKDPEYKNYVLREIVRYPAIKERKRQIVLAHALGKLDLRKSGRSLMLIST